MKWTRGRWNRRKFLEGSAIGIGGLLLPRCGGADPLAADTDGGVAPDAGAEDAGLFDAGSLDAGVTPQCEETEDNIEGPFYRPGAPNRTVLGAPAGFDKLRIEGTVRGLGASCAALNGALLDVWQADGTGAYDNASAEFRFRGRMSAGASGRYAFETVLPGRYLNGPTYRPRHIHFKVSHPGFVLLTTQLYFEGDPFLADDPFMHPSLVIPLRQESDGLRGTFDIVLAAV